MRDLLGGDYYVHAGNLNDPKARLRVGDKLEYKMPLLSAAVSATVSQVSYQRIDYFQLLRPDGSAVTTDWTRFTGYSVKAGANYNLSEHNNIFFNVSYNSKVPFFTGVYSNAGLKYQNVRPEGISSAEIGYGISYPSLK